MLGVEAAVRLLALQYAPLVAVIGDRFVPDEAPQATQQTSIVYSRTNDTRESNLDNDQQGVSGLAQTRLQFITLAADTQSFRKARQAHEFLRWAIHGFRGTVSNNASPPETLFIQRIEYSGGFSDNGVITQRRIVESVATVYHAERPPS